LSEDTGSSAFLELDQKRRVLGARLEEAGSFVDPGVLPPGAARIPRLLAQDPALKIYRHPLDEILRAAPHTLNDEGEALVARFALMNNSGDSAYTILTNADVPWPTIKLSTGEDARLDGAGYTKYRAVAN